MALRSRPAAVRPGEAGGLMIDRISGMTADAADPAGMYSVGAAAHALWAHDLSLPFLETAVNGLRAQGRLGMLAQGASMPGMGW